MNMKEKFGFGALGVAGAAALASSSPEKPPRDPIEDAPVLVADKETGDQIITLPEETTPEYTAPQYSPEEIEEILSGTTGEVDSMTTEQIEQLEKE